ncbi:MAG TPA: hypothetical protein VLA37_10585 [Sphingomonadaceae bacterium]|nr:hypothetical protein [Sphingomonadaceae bacterium]
MNIDQTAKAPWHLWAVGVVSLLWNCVGAMDYILTKIQHPDYIAALTESMGVDTQTAIAYFTGFPLWMNLSWAIAVWTAVAGSVLLLLRNRYAFHAFVLSLIGLVLASYYQLYANPVPGMTDSAIPLAFTAAILVITLALIWYARAMVAKGVLR